MEIIYIIYGLAIFLMFTMWRTNEGSKISFALEKAILFGASTSSTEYELEGETDHYIQIAFLCVIVTLTYTTKND